MTETWPIFNLVPVTQELSEAVTTAQYPRSLTVVKKCVVASIGSHPSEGMENPDFQELSLRHLPVLEVYVIRGNTILPDMTNHGRVAA